MTEPKMTGEVPELGRSSSPALPLASSGRPLVAGSSQISPKDANPTKILDAPTLTDLARNILEKSHLRPPRRPPAGRLVSPDRKQEGNEDESDRAISTTNPSLTSRAAHLCL